MIKATLFFVLFLIFLGIFLLVYKIEHRNLTVGIILVITLLMLFNSAQGLFSYYSDTIDAHLPLAITVKGVTGFIMSVIGFVPTAMVLITIWYGVTVIRKEGLGSQNARTLGFGIVLIAYTIIWPLIGGFNSGIIFQFIYGIIGTCVIYLIALKSMYTLSSIINLIHKKGGKDLDYLIVMGAGLRGDKVEILMDRRLEKVIELRELNPGAKVIVTGGWSKDEKIITPAEMAQRLVEMGIPESEILIDEDSIDTVSDINGAKALIIGDKAESLKGIDVSTDKGAKLFFKKLKIALVTSNYHVFRSLIVAKKAKVKCIGYGTRVRTDYRMNAFIREYLHYLKLSKKIHITLLCIFIAIGIILITFILVKLPGSSEHLFD